MYFGIKNDYINHYIDYSIAPTGGTTAYHLAAGLAVLSAITNGRYYVSLGHNQLFTNLWITILGRSTVARKTTIIVTAERLLRMVYEKGKAPVFPDQFTGEGLEKVLRDYSSGIFIYSELDRLFSAFEKSYMAGAKEMLTDFYDVPDYTHKQLSNSSIEIEYPCFTILAGTTPDKLINSKIIKNPFKHQDGFLQRFLFVAEDRNAFFPEKNIRPVIGLREELVKNLRIIHNNTPGSDRVELDFKKDPEKLFYNWRKKIIGSYLENEVLLPSVGRLCSAAIKIASLYAISEASMSIKIEHMQDAITTATVFLDALPQVVDNPTTDFGTERKKLLEIFGGYSAPVVPYTHILTEMNMLQWFVARLIETMIARKEIEEAVEFSAIDEKFYRLRGDKQ